MSEAPVLVLRDIGKQFGATAALAGVSFTLRPRTIHALVGENGAGKTTLMRIAYGLLGADAGHIEIHGTPMGAMTPRTALSRGVAMVQQHFSLVPRMTVAENVALGGRGSFDAGQTGETLRVLSERTGLRIGGEALVETLSVAQQQRLEILKALAHDATTLILDEPTAVLAPREAQELLRWVRRFADDGGAVVLITHSLRDALSADDVTVLRHGNTVLSAATSSLTEEALAVAMLGSPTRAGGAEVGPGGDVPAAPPHAASRERASVLTLDGISLVDARGVTRLLDAHVTVRCGEIVGVAGLDGSGHDELLRIAARRVVPSRGTVRAPAQIGFIPEDRHRDGVILDFSVAENLALRSAGTRRGVMRWREIAARAVIVIRDFDVRGANAVAQAAQLSGGNQQKLVLARELEGNPALVVAVNPTRGLDVGAARAVRERLQRAAADGAAVLMYSSDLDELLPIAHRLLVVHAGRVAQSPLNREAAGAAMLGAA